MQDDKLLAKRPPDNKQRLDQHSQIGLVLDQLLDPSLELHRPDRAHLEAEVAQSAAQVVLDGDRLRLQQLAMGRRRNGTTLGFIDWQRSRVANPLRCGVRTGNGIAVPLTSKHAGKLAATVPHRMVTY